MIPLSCELQNFRGKKGGKAKKKKKRGKKEKNQSRVLQIMVPRVSFWGCAWETPAKSLMLGGCCPETA